MNYNKYFKIGTLCLVLVVPLLLYIFLVSNGENHYKVRYFHPKGLKEVSKDSKNLIDTVYHTIPDFEFIDQDNKKITKSDFKNCVYVVDFFFTRCGTICPKMTHQLTRVQEHFKSSKDFKMMSCTIDPEFDKTNILKSYAKSYNSDLNLWSFVTGEKYVIYDLAIAGFFINAAENIDSSEPFVHSDKLILVDADNHIRGYYDGTNPEDVDKLIVEIGILLYEKKFVDKNE